MQKKLKDLVGINSCINNSETQINLVAVGGMLPLHQNSFCLFNTR
jgi:hypothetical protein